MWALWKVKNTENYKEMYLYSFINWRWVWRYLLPQTKMQGVEIVKVDKLKYLKYIQSNWKCVKKRVQADWSGWSVRRDVWLKYSSKSEREGLQDGSETCDDIWFGDSDTDKRIGGRARVGGTKDVHWKWQKCKKIRNEYIRDTAEVEQFGDKVWVVKTRWSGYVRRRYNVYTGQSMLKMGLPVRRTSRGLWM